MADGTRADSNFSAVVPLLQTVLDLTRESARAYGVALSLNPYDALLDLHAPSMRSTKIDSLFDDYATFLPNFLASVLDRQAVHGVPIRLGPVPVNRQRVLVEDLARTVGFDPRRGRIDESAHPFSTGYPGDQRITVAYDEKDPMFAVMAALHECRHAVYEAGRPIGHDSR